MEKIYKRTVVSKLQFRKNIQKFMEKIYKRTVVSKLQHESQQHKAHLIGNQWLDILCSVERLYDTFLYEVEGKQMISRKSTS